MAHYIGRYTASTDVQAALNNGELLKPYVAYIDGTGLDYDSKIVVEPGEVSPSSFTTPSIAGTTQLVLNIKSTNLYVDMAAMLVSGDWMQISGMGPGSGDYDYDLYVNITGNTNPFASRQGTIEIPFYYDSEYTQERNKVVVPIYEAIFTSATASWSESSYVDTISMPYTGGVATIYMLNSNGQYWRLKDVTNREVIASANTDTYDIEIAETQSSASTTYEIRYYSDDTYATPLYNVYLTLEQEGLPELSIEWVGQTGDTYVSDKRGGIATLLINNVGEWNVRTTGAAVITLITAGTGDSQIDFQVKPMGASGTSNIMITATTLDSVTNTYTYHITNPGGMVAPTVVWSNNQSTAITVSYDTTAATIDVTSLGDWDAVAYAQVTATTTGTYTYTRVINPDKDAKTTNVQLYGYVNGVSAQTGAILAFTQEGNPNVQPIEIVESFITTSTTANVQIGNGANKSDEIYLKDASTSNEWSRVKSATGSTNTKINLTHSGTEGEPEEHLVKIVYYSANNPVQIGTSLGNLQATNAISATAATSNNDIDFTYSFVRGSTNMVSLTITDNVVKVVTNFIVSSYLTEIHLLHTSALPTVDDVDGTIPMFLVSGNTGTLYVDSANVTGLSAWTDALGENWTVSYVNQ